MNSSSAVHILTEVPSLRTECRSAHENLRPPPKRATSGDTVSTDS